MFDLTVLRSRTGVITSLIVAGVALTPGPVQTKNRRYNIRSWSRQWMTMCNFSTRNGNCTTLLPANAFDGKGNTRTSIGDTHLIAGSTVAQVIGDTFTFDMTTCN